MKVEEFFSEGFRLAKPEYWTIIFNCLIYLIVGIVSLPPYSDGIYLNF